MIAANQTPIPTAVLVFLRASFLLASYLMASSLVATFLVVTVSGCSLVLPTPAREVQTAQEQAVVPESNAVNSTMNSDRLSLPSSEPVTDSKSVSGESQLPLASDGVSPALNQESFRLELAKSSMNPDLFPLRRGHDTEIIGIFKLPGPNGQTARVLTVDRSGVVLMWALKQMEARELLKLPPEIGAVAFSASALRIAVAHKSSVEIYDLGRGTERRGLQQLRARVTALDFSPKGDALLIAGADGRIYRWRFVFAEHVRRLKDQEHVLERYVGHPSVVSAIRYHPYGRVFFSTDWQGGVNAWLGYDTDYYGGAEDENLFGFRFFSDEPVRHKIPRPGVERIEELVVSEDGSRVLISAQNGMVELWKVRGFRREAEVQAHQGLPYAIAISPDGVKAATAGRDGFLRVWSFVDQEDDPKLKNFELESETSLEDVSQMLFLDDDTLLVGVSNGELLSVSLTELAEEQE